MHDLLQLLYTYKVTNYRGHKYEYQNLNEHAKDQANLLIAASPHPIFHRTVHILTGGAWYGRKGMMSPEHKAFASEWGYRPSKTGISYKKLPGKQVGKRSKIPGT